ncbi:MAG: HlyC/CorC family transporter [Clostridiales bacterium]|nr:HlyC/CorC family transporter [Clostridiales bacterium]
MDENPLIWQLALQLLLIALNATFACAEIAIISMNDAKLAKLAAAGDKRAIALTSLVSQPARFLATIQVGITLAGFLGSAFAADNFSEMLVEALVGAGVTIPIRVLDTLCVVLITLVLSYFTLVLGELVPKRIAMRRPEPLALGMAGAITVIARIFKPIVSLLTMSTNGILRLLGIDPNAHDDEVTEEEIRMLIDVGGERGAIDQVERNMLQNVLEFNDISADEILTHRTQVVALWLEDSDEQWARTIAEHRHSHYPVCDGSGDDVVGVLNAKDYFRLPDRSRDEVMKRAVSRPHFVPETIKSDVLFREMKKNRNHFAVVLDEHGGMSGIVTMSDLLEELVGDFSDDDRPVKGPLIQKIGDHKWRMSGATPLSEVARVTGLNLPDDDYDTLGGLIFSLLTIIPQDGDTFAVDGYGLHIDVTELKNHRVEQAQLALLDPSPVL